MRQKRKIAFSNFNETHTQHIIALRWRVLIYAQTRRATLSRIRRRKINGNLFHERYLLMELTADLLSAPLRGVLQYFNDD